MIYAGIGSRETPEWVLTIFERMGSWMAKRGDKLRSGGADGADSAFENGCNAANGQKKFTYPGIISMARQMEMDILALILWNP